VFTNGCGVSVKVFLLVNLSRFASEFGISVLLRFASEFGISILLRFASEFGISILLRFALEFGISVIMVLVFTKAEFGDSVIMVLVFIKEGSIGLGKVLTGDCEGVSVGICTGDIGINGLVYILTM